MSIIPRRHNVFCDCDRCRLTREELAGERIRYFKIRHTSIIFPDEQVIVQLLNDENVRALPEQSSVIEWVRIQHAHRLHPCEIISIEECGEHGGPPPKPEDILMTKREAREATTRIENKRRELDRDVIQGARDYVRNPSTIAQLTSAFDKMKKAVVALDDVYKNDPDYERLMKYYAATHGTMLSPTTPV